MIQIFQNDCYAKNYKQVRANPKRGKYTAYRNYFCTRGKDDEWEKLVELGIATYHTDDPSVYYHVSKDGLELMESILGFKIVESD